MTLAAIQIDDSQTNARATRSRTLEGGEPLVAVLERLLEHRFCGELVITGAARGRICLYDGAIAWVCDASHHEHLGDVLRRELGIPVHTLRRVIEHCKATGQRFGEGMVELGVLQVAELRECLRRHIEIQFQRLRAQPGPLRVEIKPQAHRFDHALTFELSALLDDSAELDEAALAHVEALLDDCRRRLPRIAAGCVVDARTGALLGSLHDDGDDSHALLGLCCAGVRRLIDNRVTGHHDGEPSDALLGGEGLAIVVHRLAWQSRWLLVLGGKLGFGVLLSTAHAADQALDPSNDS